MNHNNSNSINDSHDKIIEMIKNSIGKRTVQEYADCVGLSRAAVYKILAAKNKHPLQKDLIKKLYENQYEGCGYTLKEFEEANQLIGRDLLHEGIIAERNVRLAIFEYFYKTGKYFKLVRTESDTIQLVLEVDGNEYIYAIICGISHISIFIEKDLGFILYNYGKSYRENNGNKLFFAFDTESSFQEYLDYLEKENITGNVSLLLIDTQNFEILEKKDL